MPDGIDASPLLKDRGSASTNERLPALSKSVSPPLDTPQRPPPADIQFVCHTRSWALRVGSMIWSRRRVNRCPRHYVPAETVDPDVISAGATAKLAPSVVRENHLIFWVLNGYSKNNGLAHIELTH